MVRGGDADLTIDRRRLARAFVLVTWTGLFSWLLLSGELVRYIGPKTQWVVVFGAVALAATTGAYLFTIRTDRQAAPLTVADAAGLALLLVPAATVVLFPTPELGSLAAQRRSAGPVMGAAGSFVRVPAGEKVSFVEIDYASRSEQYAATVGVLEGRRVRLLGFVSEATSDQVALTRFFIACCAADAVPYTVQVETPAGSPVYSKDQWLEVFGALGRRSQGFVVVADRITRTGSPRNPYLS